MNTNQENKKSIKRESVAVQAQASGQDSAASRQKMLGDTTRQLIQNELKRYEHPRSAILPVLHWVQKNEGKGWLPPELIEAVASEMKMPLAWVQEVVSFYTMFNKKSVGKYHVQVCGNISCTMSGGRQLLQALCQEFKSKPGEVSPCGKFTFSKVECLGSCDTAPMMQVNERYIENLSPDTAIQKLKQLD